MRTPCAALLRRVDRIILSTLLATGCASPDPTDPMMVSPSSTDTGTSETNGSTVAPASTSMGTSTVTTQSTNAGSSGLSTSGTVSTAPTTTSSAATTETSATATSTGTTDTSTSSDSGAATAPTFEDVQSLLLYSCVLVSCHTPLYNQPTLMDYDGMLHDRMLSWQVEPCGNAPLVKPGEPENSAILKLVTQGCGEFVMPPLCTDPCVDSRTYEDIEAWIKAGAPK